MPRSRRLIAPGHLRVSIVIPCRDENRTIGECIATVRDTLDRHGIRGEIIVVDNGSTDESAASAERLGARVLLEPAKGYGNALRRGFAAAEGEYIVMGDGDGSYDFGQLPLLLQPLADGADLVIGSRVRGTILPGAMPFMHRYLGTPVLTWLTRRLFRLRVTDVNSGMRALRRSTLERMELSTTGMELATEMLIKAAAAGLTITEVPIVFRPDNRDRQPHLRPWRDGWRHLKFILMFAFLSSRCRRFFRPPMAHHAERVK